MRKLLALMLSLMLLPAARLAVAASEPPRLALGLIVKLRDQDTKVASRSLMRVQATAQPAGSRAALNMRLSAAARRQGLAFADNKPTAFAAEVLHNGAPVSLEQAEAEAARLRKDPDVEWVVVNEMLRPALVDLNDPGYGQQTWLQARDLGARRLAVANFPRAWEALSGRTLSPVVVAVLDTGILPAPDLVGRMLPGYDFVSDASYSGDGNGIDPDPTDPGESLSKVPAFLRGSCQVSPVAWHGLSVTAMLAAVTGNALDGAGALAPLPGLTVLPVRVGGMCGATVSDLVEGMLWSAGLDNYHGSPARNLNPARVINLSFGGDGSCVDLGNGVHDVAWLYRETIKTLKEQGVLVVASAGNGDARSGLGREGATRPANCAGVLAVTGLNERGYKARYANLLRTDGVQSFGLAAASGDVDAQGYLVDSGIVTLTNTGDDQNAYFELRPMVGTSLAAPVAASVAALMLAADPSLTVDDLLWGLTRKVAAFPDVSDLALPTCVPGVSGQGNCVCTTDTCGSGVVDAEQAVGWAIEHALQGSGGGVSPSSNSGSPSVCYFNPSREGGGGGCSSPSSAGNDQGGGGGGAASLLDLWALTLIALGLAGRSFRGGKR